MNKIVRLKKVTRVQNNTLAGKVYYPRIDFSGSDLDVLGWQYGDTIKITVDMETKKVVIEKVDE
jgi:hypothetical protein